MQNNLYNQSTIRVFTQTKKEQYNKRNINNYQFKLLIINSLFILPHFPFMQQKQRLNRISRQLTKLNSLIQYTKNESIIAMEVLKDCRKLSETSEEDYEFYDKNSINNISDMFDQADSRSTILIGNNHFIQSHENQSLEISRPIKIRVPQIDQYSKSRADIFASNISTQGFKQIAAEISQIKAVDTTVKKTKLVKSNLGKNKKTYFDKNQRANSKNEKLQKINRIKSENKLVSNSSGLKRASNLIKEQFQIRNTQKNKTLAQFSQNIIIPNKNYLSNKIQTLNSKRNGKNNSIMKCEKPDKQSKQHKLQKQQRIDKHSKSKFHLNLQKQVTMKITDLKIKKNLCLVETSYLSASVKITKEEITRIEDSSTKYSDETLLKYFILKSIIKFISQYNDETWTNSQDIEIDNQTVTNTIKKPQKFIKIINKLPDILRRRNIVSEDICKQFIQDKLFIQQKLHNLAVSKTFQKEPLYHYLCELHHYIEFLLNNSMIHETKRHKIFNPTSEEFFSDRSAKDMKNTVIAKEDMSRNKDFSERKKKVVSALKRVTTSKALKKGIATTKPKKI